MDSSLDHFLKAQQSQYETILTELGSGQKRTHWMWYVFPQIEGLGRSETARFYAIKNLCEARDYLHHPTLGARLIECTEVVLKVQNRSLQQIFGSPDDLKFCSSITLFEYVAMDNMPFDKAVEHYCKGRRDEHTLKIVNDLHQ